MAPQDREKKGGLTLEKLASYDDVITDALVDKVYYWTTIRKNRGGRFSASRGLHAEDIGDIIRKHIVLNKDPTEAVQHLLRLPGLRKYLSSLKDEKEKEHFTRHLRRYVSIYMPDCPFEVTTTNRYTISEHEASIKARRDINPREEIKYLTGVQVAMTEEQEKTLELARKDFSLVISSRKKTRSLFLGPARFANHDCDANARLSTKGYDGMQIVAVKPIAFGDEITVSYGEDYFGEDNEECLCHTCEEKQVNGWAPFKRVETDSDEDEDEDEDDEEKTPAPEEPLPEQDGSYSFRRKRKYGTTIEENSSETLPASKRVKVEVKKVESSPEEKPQSPSKRHAPQPLRKRTLKKAYSASSLRKEVPVSSIENTTTNLSSSTQLSREIRTQQRVGLLTVTLDETSTSREDTPDSSLPSILADSPKSSESTDATSVDEDQPMANTEQISKVDLDVIKQKPGLGVVTVKTETTIATPSWTALFDGDSSSDISDLSDSLDFDDKKQEMVKRKRPKTPPTIRNTRSLSRHAAQNGLGTPISGDSQLEEGYVENTRKPGDYMTSAALLSAKYSKWVECSTCDEEFVQEDGYLTRKECPRCERHSILYGFTWPKTDREGKHDTDERILDHRTVHRFVDADEEKTLKKEKGRKLMRERIASRFSTPRSDYRESSMSMEAESGRKRKRVRKTM